MKKRLKLTLTSNSIGTSYVEGCVFYQLDFDEKIILTNYDFIFPYEIKRDLIKLELWIVFNIKTNKHIYISNDFLNNCTYNEFKEKILEYFLL